MFIYITLINCSSVDHKITAISRTLETPITRVDHSNFFSFDHKNNI